MKWQYIWISNFINLKKRIKGEEEENVGAETDLSHSPSIACRFEQWLG